MSIATGVKPAFRTPKTPARPGANPIAAARSANPVFKL
jgi:hypothetical protein